MQGNLLSVYATTLPLRIWQEDFSDVDILLKNL